ncbi:MAG: YbaB/EbfC family nucleoid-associated protein [Solobacterium sp.]|nr:YbaB/EbfC family nucleoid-associated protein [Solobacterium sp.]
MDISKLMEQAQKMQQELGKMQDELKATVYLGKAGGSEGVTIRMNGDYEVEEVIISDELFEMNDKEMLQDLLLIAFNDAAENAAADREAKLGSATQGISLPGF